MKKSEEIRLQRLLASRLKTERLRMELTQAQLARRLGISRVHFVRIESAKHLPSLFLIIDICKALSIKPDWLVGVDQIEELNPQ